MPGRTQLVPALPPGAGRTFSLTWPDNIGLSGGTPNSNVTPRPGSPSYAGVTITALGAEAQNSVGYYRGRYAWKFPSSLAGKGVAMLFNAVCQIFQDQLTGDVYDPFACWRIRATLAFDALTAGLNAQDLGIMLACSADTSVFNNTAGGGNTRPGMTFGPTNNAQLSVWSRLTNVALNPAPKDFVANIAAAQTPNFQDWHTYELRLIGATKAGGAVLRFLVDGLRVLDGVNASRAGLVLPDADAGAFNNKGGWRLGIANYSENACANLYISRVELTAAPTEQALE